MSFTLTKEHVHSIIDPTAEGNWEEFIGAIDPEVHWIVVDPTFDEASLAGTYVSLPSLFSLPTCSSFYHSLFLANPPPS